jgi:hypothetical protein
MEEKISTLSGHGSVLAQAQGPLSLAGEKTRGASSTWRNSGSRPDSQKSGRADSGTRSLTPTAARRFRPPKLFRPDLFSRSLTLAASR